MCRLFGFRSVIQSQVHRSLIGADNALANQSAFHPDGWGVAYYVSEAPHLIRSARAAFEDNLFSRVSGVVSSETVLAHIRKATTGAINPLNTHPFQYGRWVFAHNGNIKDFAKHRESLMTAVAPRLRRFILGETDSELLFFLILTNLGARVDLSRKGCPVQELAAAGKAAVDKVQEVVGPMHQEDGGPPEETYLTFLLTDGEAMLAHQGGKNLYYSTFKNHCGERDTCPSFSFECENATKTGYINHLIFSSEPLSGENVWIPLKPGDMIGVDWGMKMTQF